MTQWEYDTIMMVLDGGAPAIADKLGASLQNLVNERNQLSDENEKLKKENESLKLEKHCCSCDKGQPDSCCEDTEKLSNKKSASKQSK